MSGIALYALVIITWVIASGPGVLPLIFVEQALLSSEIVRSGQFHSSG